MLAQLSREREIHVCYVIHGWHRIVFADQVHFPWFNFNGLRFQVRLISFHNCTERRGGGLRECHIDKIYTSPVSLPPSSGSSIPFWLLLPSLADEPTERSHVVLTSSSFVNCFFLLFFFYPSLKQSINQSARPSPHFPCLHLWLLSLSFTDVAT